MKMNLSNKEEFLLDMYAYLKNGSDRSGESRTDREVREVLFNKEKFMEIDIIEDEMSYHGLEIDDFEWHDKELTVGELILALTAYPKDAKIIIEDSDGSASSILTKKDVKNWWTRDVQIGGLTTGERENVMMITKYEGDYYNEK